MFISTFRQNIISSKTTSNSILSPRISLFDKIFKFSKNTETEYKTDFYDSPLFEIYIDDSHSENKMF